MKNVVLLGSTGSIGTSTAKVAEDLPNDIRLVGLAAGGNAELLAKQAKQFRPERSPRRKKWTNCARNSTASG